MPKYKKKIIAQGSQSNEPVIKMKLQILYGSNIALGPGKAELLEGIAKTGSISAAGKLMDMSYRRAWLLVDEMNRCFRTPLVETAKGGQRGGGSRLTALGKDVLAKYRLMDSAAKQASLAYLPLFKDFMAEHPPESEVVDDQAGNGLTDESGSIPIAAEND